MSALDSYLKKQGKYNKNESKVTFGDVQDSLILVSNNFSTSTSYENQTKKIHHQPLRSGGHDRVFAEQLGGLFHRESV